MSGCEGGCGCGCVWVSKWDWGSGLGNVVDEGAITSASAVPVPDPVAGVLEVV